MKYLSAAENRPAWICVQVILNEDSIKPEDFDKIKNRVIKVITNEYLYVNREPKALWKRVENRCNKIDNVNNFSTYFQQAIVCANHATGITIMRYSNDRELARKDMLHIKVNNEEITDETKFFPWESLEIKSKVITYKGGNKTVLSLSVLEADLPAFQEFYTANECAALFINAPEEMVDERQRALFCIAYFKEKTFQTCRHYAIPEEAASEIAPFLLQYDFNFLDCILAITEEYLNRPNYSSILPPKEHVRACMWLLFFMIEMKKAEIRQNNSGKSQSITLPPELFYTINRMLPAEELYKLWFRVSEIWINRQEEYAVVQRVPIASPFCITDGSRIIENICPLKAENNIVWQGREKGMVSTYIVHKNEIGEFVVRKSGKDGTPSGARKGLLGRIYPFIEKIGNIIND